MLLYLDTSAFLKFLVLEEHSAMLIAAVRDVDLWSSMLLAVESHRAALRLGVAASVVDTHLETVTLILPAETTYMTARGVGTSSLRALDALHLAAALELGDDLDGIVTYDRRLAEAAVAVAVPVVSPGMAGGWWTLEK